MNTCQYNEKDLETLRAAGPPRGLFLQEPKPSNKDLLEEIQALRKEVKDLRFFASLSDQERRIFNELRKP